MSMYTEFEKFVKAYAVDSMTWQTSFYRAVSMVFSKMSDGRNAVNVMARSMDNINVVNFGVYETHKPRGLLTYTIGSQRYEDLTARQVIQHLIAEEGCYDDLDAYED